MNRTEFWKLIETTINPDKEQQYIDIVDALSLLSVEEVCHFGQFVGLYSEHSESPATYIACKLINGSASDDTELYFRLWLISEGENTFFNFLENPDTLADITILNNYCEFEMLMAAIYCLM